MPQESCLVSLSSPPLTVRTWWMTTCLSCSFTETCHRTTSSGCTFNTAWTNPNCWPAQSCSVPHPFLALTKLTLTKLLTFSPDLRAKMALCEDNKGQNLQIEKQGEMCGQLDQLQSSQKHRFCNSQILRAPETFFQAQVLDTIRKV